MKRLLQMMLMAVFAAWPAAAQKIRVVTSTTDLHDIAHEVGGNRIHAVSITVGYQDPHFVEAKPSFVLELRKADLFAFVGLDLEVGWMSLLLEGARNPKINAGGAGYLDVSKSIPLLDVATGPVDRSQGDVHPRGNPHYWLDPANGVRIARLFRDEFTRLDPAGQLTYAKNTEAFERRLAAAEATWQEHLARIKGKPVVAYHTSWRYLAAYTGMNIVGFMEPKPGVPPSPSQLAGLIQTMKRTGAKVIIMEPWYDRKMANFVAGKTGAKVLVLPPSVGAIRSIKDYVDLLAHDIAQIDAALR